MTEYINREEIMKFPIRRNNCDNEHGDIRFINGIEVVMEYIEEIPSADVVEVVRCKDCMYKKNAKTNHKGFLICSASGMEITDDDFCSYGEKVDFKNDDI